MNVGNCHFCHEPVLAAEGQRITWIKLVGRHRRSGDYFDTIERPTHKACRKKSGSNKRNFTMTV